MQKYQRFSRHSTSAAAHPQALRLLLTLEPGAAEAFPMADDLDGQRILERIARETLPRADELLREALSASRNSNETRSALLEAR